MGSTYVTATIIAPKMRKDYSFRVDTGATYMGLPQPEIDDLGLQLVPSGWVQVLTGTGIVRRDTYVTFGELQGQGFAATVIASPVPVIGYEILENLRFRVNPVTQELERVPLEEPHPPFQLLNALLSNEG